MGNIQNYVLFFFLFGNSKGMAILSHQLSE
jgi:hypothetical protein